MDADADEHAVEPHGHEDAWVRIGRFILRVLTILEWCCLPSSHILAIFYFLHIWDSDSICIGLGSKVQWLVVATPIVSLFVVGFTFVTKEFGDRRAWVRLLHAFALSVLLSWLFICY